VLKRSSQITLVLIGTAALPACSPGGPTIVHDRYASLEDCTADWGRPESCDREDPAAVSPYGGTGSGGGWNGGNPIGRILFRGPDYPVGERMESQFRALQGASRSGVSGALPSGPTSHAIEHAVPSRSGFGSMSHFFGRLG
jgi:uncharacterized protein YgiB involved in biofilm formation